MVSKQEIDKQLKELGFNRHGWGRTELGELPAIILPGEEIFECVNGIYEGGFAMLVATDVRLLLIDKKPLNYLTVEDLRYDVINEIDYSHRIIGAHIIVASGEKFLKFTSLNQQRLRKLISHVQHCMSEYKKKHHNEQENQSQHLEEINHQLQAYLAAQHEQQQKMHEQIQSIRTNQEGAASMPSPLNPIRPDPKLSDYLYAQSLLAQHNKSQSEVSNQSETKQIEASNPKPTTGSTNSSPTPSIKPEADSDNTKTTVTDLYAEGMQEIFGKQGQASQTYSDNTNDDSGTTASDDSTDTKQTGGKQQPSSEQASIEINPMTVAYSKLPMALRNRKFGRPSFHSHSKTKPELVV